MDTILSFSSETVAKVHRGGLRRPEQRNLDFSAQEAVTLEELPLHRVLRHLNSGSGLGGIARAAELMQEQITPAARAAELMQEKMAPAARAAELMQEKMAPAARAAELMQEQITPAARAAKLVQEHMASAAAGLSGLQSELAQAQVAEGTSAVTGKSVSTPSEIRWYLSYLVHTVPSITWDWICENPIATAQILLGFLF
jgi:hypothetical protein